MARSKGNKNMPFAELAAIQARIERAKAEWQDAERAAVRQKLIETAKEAGFDIQDLFGRGRKGNGKGSVAIKYRDKSLALAKGRAAPAQSAVKAFASRRDGRRHPVGPNANARFDRSIRVSLQRRGCRPPGRPCPGAGVPGCHRRKPQSTIPDDAQRHQKRMRIVA